ncbi:MAG: transglutaminase domain-containing protein [Aquificae bacterium]|nr:transglutaminase domain-containing protein [Aquificota bacterium]
MELENFLNSVGVEPRKISDDPEAYRIKLRDVSQTVEIIKRFIKEYTKDPRLHLLVAEIIRDCPSKAYSCYLRRIVDFVKRSVKYVKDPQKLETLRSPIRTLELGFGDCDDHTILAGTLLRIAGFPVKIVLGDTNHDGRYEHVFIEAYVPGKGWVVVDTTARKPLSPKPYPTKEIDLFSEEELSGEELSGIVDWLRQVLFRKQEKKREEKEEDSRAGLLLSLGVLGAIWLLMRR